jgi:hypothetical protein
MDEAAFVDEQIRLLQTEFALSDVPVWEGANDYPPVSDAALNSAIRKRALARAGCLLGSRLVRRAVNTSLRNDALRLLGATPRRALLSQLQGDSARGVVAAATVAAGGGGGGGGGRGDDFFRAFPDQWPDRTHTTAAQRHAYEAKRADVFALAQAVAAAKEELAGRRRVAAMLAPLDALLPEARPDSALAQQWAAVTRLGKRGRAGAAPAGPRARSPTNPSLLGGLAGAIGSAAGRWRRQPAQARRRRAQAKGAQQAGARARPGAGPCGLARAYPRRAPNQTAAGHGLATVAWR